MVYLAEENRMVTGVEIANKMQIPPTYLLTIMAALKKAGFVSVKRGNVGGYSLAKSQSEISLWDIMEVMEGTMQINRDLKDDAFSDNKATGMGQVREVYSSLQSSLETQLRSVTLAKLVENCEAEAKKEVASVGSVVLEREKANA
jgi:Rrf2 family protein